MSSCIAGTQRWIKLKISCLVNITHNRKLFIKISFVCMQCSLHVYSAYYFFDNVFFIHDKWASKSVTYEEETRIPKACFLFHVTTALVDQGLLVVEVKRPHSDTSHWAGLLWTSYMPDAGTSTWQRTTLTIDRSPCTRWDSNSQSQQANGHRSTP